MAYEQKDMSGSLFKNNKREKDTHPNATGTAMIDGVEYWVSAWTKYDKNENPWQSLAFKRKEEKQDKPPSGNAGKGRDYSEDVPFN